MQIKVHLKETNPIAEVVAENILINHHEDGTDLLGNLYFQGYNKVILYKKNITSDFFDLQNKMAGEILQKFSNYRVRLVIVGDFSGFTKKSIQDFMYESNNGRLVNFLPTLSEALRVLSN